MISVDKMMSHTIPDAVEHGQFTHSYSQVALTNMFEGIKTNEIIVFSGHNPDFHRKIGIGWWEDSPNIVKYAIAKKHKFFTFTSLEPIFCHYAAFWLLITSLIVLAYSGIVFKVLKLADFIKYLFNIMFCENGEVFKTTCSLVDRRGFLFRNLFSAIELLSCCLAVCLNGLFCVV